jgi:uncharacterized membrane protein YciS (DUF1049 family)
MKWLRNFLFLGLSLGLAWAGWSFRSGNADRIDLDLVWLHVHNVEIWWVLVLALAMGLSLGALVVGPAWLRQRLLNRRYRKSIQQLEGEVHRLRSLPLVESFATGREEPAKAASSGQV